MDEPNAANGEQADPPETDAPAPFNKPTADLILRSSDRMNFRVRKAILAEASPVFEDMFTFPLPQSPDEPAGSPPVVDMAEDGHTLEGLLSLCYPIRKMPIQSLEEATILLDAARKYSMDGALTFLGDRLIDFAKAGPVRVYALATRYQLQEEVVRAAAKAFLNIYIHNAHLKSLEDLNHISASAYLRLLDYRDRCAAAAVRVFDTYTWIDSSRWCWLSCGSSGCASGCAGPFKDGRHSRLAAWWEKMMSYCRKLVLANPCGEALASRSCTAVALAEAGKCNNCRSLAPHELEGFMALLINEVDKAVAQVELDIV
ncbi:hypothetical protein DAEQUDRAFT_814611 [Daedalea quercina L-15889]|uniref:BTB domain-containing protein n=1 Tax=Daedalea quercina L-15889 TaxID=1314783 RepID=A0A165LY27_9APHY|nr:hypothetical protein DAEQUDRAFT_814611 [Daedalea quercina L-15889]